MYFVKVACVYLVCFDVAKIICFFFFGFSSVFFFSLISVKTQMLFLYFFHHPGLFVYNIS